MQLLSDQNNTGIPIFFKEQKIKLTDNGTEERFSWSSLNNYLSAEKYSQ